MPAVDNKKTPSSSAANFNITKYPQVPTPRPLGSLRSQLVHLASWSLWSWYISLRSHSNGWAYIIFLLEAFVATSEIQNAIELSTSMFGTWKPLGDKKYVLQEGPAPTVHVLITACGEDLEMIMDTVRAAATQQYAKNCFCVFLLDDAADDALRLAVNALNQDLVKVLDVPEVVYLARKKTPGERHYYKSGNLRFGLEETASMYGSSDYFAALDADMIPNSDWLSRCVPHLIRNPDAAIVSPPQLFYNIPEGDSMGQDTNLFAQILEPIRDHSGVSQCSGSGYIMRRSALDSIGGWPLVNVGEDILCSYQIQQQGWKTLFIPDEVQFGLAPGSFHAYLSQRLRWTNGSLVIAKRFRFFLPIFGQNFNMTASQRSLSMMHAVKAYLSPLTLVAQIMIPLGLIITLNPGKALCDRNSMRFIFLGLFVTSKVAKKLIFGRLGHSAWAVLCSFIQDPADSVFKVTGAYSSAVDERSGERRKPVLQRMSSTLMIMHIMHFLLTASALSYYVLSIAYKTARWRRDDAYLYTGATLKLLDIVWATSVPVRYMLFPPTVPERRELLEKDCHGVYHANQKGWIKRDGGSSFKLVVEVSILLLLDWL